MKLQLRNFEREKRMVAEGRLPYQVLLPPPKPGITLGGTRREWWLRTDHPNPYSGLNREVLLPVLHHRRPDGTGTLFARTVDGRMLMTGVTDGDSDLKYRSKKEAYRVRAD